MNTKDWIKKPHHGNWDDDDEEDGFPIMLPHAISIYNFHVLNSRSSSVAWHKTAKIFQIGLQNLMFNIYTFLKHHLEDGDVFVKHCQEMEKILGIESDKKETFVYLIYHVALEFNLPIPLKQSWVQNNLFDFHYYCANIFWPKVKSEYLRRKQTHGKNVLNVMKVVMIKHKQRTKQVMEDYLVGRLVETCFDNSNGKRYKIYGVNYKSNPKTNLNDGVSFIDFYHWYLKSKLKLFALGT